MKTITCKIAFIGAGAMGGSIASGLLEAGALDPSSVAVADPCESILSQFTKQGVATFLDSHEMITSFQPELVVLAVKPQVLPGVVEPLASILAGKLVVSIAAGVSVSTLESLVPTARIIRCMPNLPMATGSGAVAITASKTSSPDDVQLVRSLLSHLGTAEVMSETQLDAAGVVCGCSPAFFALFVDCLTRAGIEAGLPAATCRAMIETTMRGTASQLIDSSEHPRAYMERVSSPAGTTIVALRELEPPLFSALTQAVSSALSRTAALAASASEG